MDESDLRGLRDLFDAEIKRIDQVLVEREKQVNLALEAAERAIDKSEQEGLRAREASNEWRQALNDRERGYVPVAAHNLLQEEITRLNARQEQQAGRRAAWIAAAGIIATLLAIGVGQIIRQGITAADVSQQIQREAPWNRDREGITRRISELERSVARQQVEIARLQSDLRAHIALGKRK